jgi:hypothetical protein
MRQLLRVNKAELLWIVAFLDPSSKDALSPHPRTPEDTSSNLPTRAITSLANDVSKKQDSPSFYLAVNYQNEDGTYTLYCLDALGRLVLTTNDLATFEVYHISIRPD